MTDITDLTPDQQKALDSLPPRRRAFVLAYVGEARGCAAEAARIAGYAHPASQGHRLLRGVAPVIRAIRDLSSPTQTRSIMSLLELRQWWTAVIVGDAEASDDERAPTLKERLKASEMLAKSLGGFLDRVEHGAEVGTAVTVVLSAEDAAKVAAESDDA